MSDAAADERDDAQLVVAPGKALRLTNMIDALVEKTRAAPLDGAARIRFLTLYEATLIEMGSTLSDALLDELWRVQTQDLSDAATFDELRVAMTELEGWLHDVLAGVLSGSTSIPRAVG
jgi:hypothetical protein